MISPNSIYLKNGLETSNMNLIMKLPILDDLQNIQNNKETEVEAQVRLIRRGIIKNLCLNLGLSREDKYLLLSLEGTMTEVICLSESTIKTLFLNLPGKYQSSPWIIIITCLFSWTELGKNSILTVHLPSWVLTICLRRVATRSCLLFLS